MSRHIRSSRAPDPSWLPVHAGFGRREILATIRAHPKSLWHLAGYGGFAFAVIIVTDVAFGSSDVLTTSVPIFLGLLAAGLYLGGLEGLYRSDQATTALDDKI